MILYNKKMSCYFDFGCNGCYYNRSFFYSELDYLVRVRTQTARFWGVRTNREATVPAVSYIDIVWWRVQHHPYKKQTDTFYILCT